MMNVPTAVSMTMAFCCRTSFTMILVTTVQYVSCQVNAKMVGASTIIVPFIICRPKANQTLGVEVMCIPMVERRFYQCKGVPIYG